MLFNAEKQFHTKTIQTYTKEEIARIHEFVSRRDPDAVEEMLSEFIKSMNRKFQRDVLSLDHYYDAREKEMNPMVCHSCGMSTMPSGCAGSCTQIICLP